MQMDSREKEYREHKKFKSSVIAACICGGLAVISIAIYFCCRYVFSAEKVSEFYTDKLFYYISYPIKKAIAYFPFSVTEMVLAICVLALIVSLIKAVVKTVRNVHLYQENKAEGTPVRAFMMWRPSVQFGLRLAALLCALLSAFILFGGINYTSLTFTEKAGFTLEETHANASQLDQLCRILSAEASAARKQCKIGVNGKIDDTCSEYNPYRLIEEAVKAYQNLPEEYDFLKKDYPRPKIAVSSLFMSNIHITGIYPYILPEAIVNVNTPIMSMPHTICHEMAHQRGYAREDEANYIAYLACVSSENPILIYSGYYTAFTYAMSDLYKADRKAWSEIASNSDQSIWMDSRQEDDFWRQFETISNQFTSAVNDTYLSVMDVEDGIHSYGRMVDLMLAQAIKDGIIL